MNTWNWSPARSDGIWRYGSARLRPIVAAAPWLTIIVIILMFHMMSSALTMAPGVLFELSGSEGSDGVQTDLVMMVLPDARGETLVFFDDARYLLRDEVSTATLSNHLAERLVAVSGKSLLVLADKRIAGGELMHLSGIARKCGVKKMLFAGKRQESSVE